jgi:outer membrane protein TolC
VRTTNNSLDGSSNRQTPVRHILWGVAISVLLSACTAKYHRHAADKQAYRIIQQVEQRIFGRTNAFDIATAYSSRKPEEITPDELIDDRTQTNRRVLTLDDALRLAVTNSRDYQAAKETLYLTALSLTGAKHVFTPRFFASSEASLTRDFREVTHRRVSIGTNGGVVFTNVSTRVGIDDKTVGRIRSEIGVSKAFASGGSFTITLANDILNDIFLYYTGDPQRSIISSISVNLAQPLLAGFGQNSAMVENLTQASRNVIYAVRDHAFFQDEFALGIVNDYFRLLSQKDTIRNNYANYLSRVDATKRLEARAQDREQVSAVDQTRQAELSAKNTYVNSVADYFTQLDEFKITLGLPLGERIFLDDSALTQVRETGLVPTSLNPAEAYKVGVQRQLPILNAIDEFEDSKRKVRIFADALKPGLDLFADASLDSERPTDYTEFDPNKIRADVGLRLDLPLDRVFERNEYRSALVSFEFELRQLTLQLDRLQDRIEEGVRTLEQRQQTFFIQTNALALANRRVESSTLLLQAGRAEARDLIEAQDAQLRAQNDVIRALVGYQEARLQLMLDIGALDTDKPQFWLKDHLPGFLPEMAPVPAAPDLAERPVVPPEELFNN